jgi:hypothetical protein
MILDATGHKTGVVYHYTDISTLLNITASHQLWLSSVFHMNDKNELFHGASVAENVIKSLNDSYEADKLQCFINYLNFLPTYSMGIFAFSLSFEGNLLSQWRGYTRKNRGVSIGFKQCSLEKRAELKGFQLVKCLYEYDEKFEHLRQMIVGLLDAHKCSESFGDFLHQRQEEIITALVVVKEEFFKEERELRLVSKPHRHLDTSEVNYRAGESIIIPYVIFDIANLNNDGSLYDQVFVGPHENPNLALTTVRDCLSHYAACREIVNSMIPLR